MVTHDSPRAAVFARHGRPVARLSSVTEPYGQMTAVKEEKTQ